MIPHVIIISYIALPQAHAHFDWASASPHCSSAAEIFNFGLIRVHSNARNSIHVLGIPLSYKLNDLKYYRDNPVELNVLKWFSRSKYLLRKGH